MCVTNVFTDRFPDGKEVIFRKLDYCQYGAPNRPCQKLSAFENPVRKINFGETTSEFILAARERPTYPNTPPRSAGSSHHRRSGEFSSDDGRLHRRKSSKRRSELPVLKPTRTHRKERIIIVDAPPTPRTPPQTFHTFTAPSSPASPAAHIVTGGIGHNNGSERRRPVIVDERPLPRARPRSISLTRNGAGNSNRNSFLWDSPSSSHTSFDSRARREAEELERRIAAERDERLAKLEKLEAARRREQRIREQDEEIRRRPVVPIPILKKPGAGRERERELEREREARQWLRPVIDQSETLQGMMGGLTLRDERSAGERAIITETEMRRRAEERDWAARRALQEREEEEMKRRLRERQMPKRRFSVGPGNRRHRVLYDDGVYRWE